MIRRWDKSKPPLGPFTLNRDTERAQGLVGWWPMADAGAAYMPDLASVNPLTIISGGMTLGAAGEPAFDLNGTTNHAYTTNVVRGSVPVTLSCWFRPTSFTGTPHPLGMGYTLSSLPVIAILINTTGTATYAARDNGGTLIAANTVNTATLNAWNFAIGTTRGTSTHRVSLNGGAVGSSTGALGAFTLNRTSIGARFFGSGTPQQYFAGQIGECCIYDVGFSDAQIQSFADPGRRFELWYPLRSRKWMVAGVGGGFQAAWARNSNVLIGVHA